MTIMHINFLASHSFFSYSEEHDQRPVVMFSVSSFLLSIQIVAALAAPPLGIINRSSVAGSINIGPSPLNSTALTEADSSAQAMSVAALHSIQSSHVSPLSPSRHVNIKIKFNAVFPF